MVGIEMDNMEMTVEFLNFGIKNSLNQFFMCLFLRSICNIDEKAGATVRR
jgi:hypothetical protein